MDSPLQLRSDANSKAWANAKPLPIAWLVLLTLCITCAQPTVGNAAGADNTGKFIDATMHHLRVGDKREWAQFPAKAEGDKLEITFTSKTNSKPYCIVLRQIDARHRWPVVLNGKRLDFLDRDENAKLAYFAIPAKGLRDGPNKLVISSTSTKPDDLRIGEIRLFDKPIDSVLNESRMNVTVTDTKGKPIPCRVTIVDSQGALVPVGAKSNDRLAVRTGMVYTKDGIASFGLPAGKYTLYITRGFEYSLEQTTINIKPGQTQAKRFTLVHQVPTPGYVACDTHVHTFTHSRHGDATIQERMITLAGEGIELPVATDHNIHIDYEKVASEMQLRKYFTPVIGNEMTTAVGHFNIFPPAKGTMPPDWRVPKWATIFRNIYATKGVRVAIMNHPRNVHSNFQPMNPKNQLAVVGENLNGEVFKANAMELVNSAALQTDPMLVFHDWFAMLNRGHQITPIGSSDSHEVAYKIVGQGRTYIRCDDSNPGKINVTKAIDSLLAGHVGVSMGLLCEMKLNGKYQPGDIAKLDKTSSTINVQVTVKGPAWTQCNIVQLYANGVKIREQKIEHTPHEDGKFSPIKFDGTFKIKRPNRDVILVAIARGPGVERLFWRIPKPYQPASPIWKSYVIGLTSPIRINADNDGQFTCALEYANTLLAQVGNDPGKKLKELIDSLNGYDQVVAAHVANALYKQSKIEPGDKRVMDLIAPGNTDIRIGFKRYAAALKASRDARKQK